MDKPPRRRLTVAEVAERLRCSTRTVFRMIADGQLERLKVRSKTLIPTWSVEQFERKAAG